MPLSERVVAAHDGVVLAARRRCKTCATQRRDVNNAIRGIAFQSSSAVRSPNKEFLETTDRGASIHPASDHRASRDQLRTASKQDSEEAFRSLTSRPCLPCSTLGSGNILPPITMTTVVKPTTAPVQVSTATVLSPDRPDVSTAEYSGPGKGKKPAGWRHFVAGGWVPAPRVVSEVRRLRREEQQSRRDDGCDCHLSV